MFNRRKNRIEDILDECLERILVNGDSIEDCLIRYRQYADELEPLLQTAASTMKAAAIEPNPNFKARARYQFHSALKDAATKKRRRFFAWQFRWVTMASFVLALLLSSGGVVAAASNSMPDSPLYQVKLATEQIQLFFTTSPEAKAELYSKLADRRVDEIIYMAEEGNADVIEDTTRRLQTHLSMIDDISNDLDAGVLYGGWQNSTKIVTEIVTTTVGTEGLLTDGASETKTVVPTICAPAPSAREGDTPPTPVVPCTDIQKPYDSPDKGLIYQLQIQSACNIAALNEALETASEDVQEALMEAIELLEGNNPTESSSEVTSTVTETVTTTAN